MATPQISIICNTFNHAKYIRDALDSFLMQKVSVPFEILVHDDASTDGTAEIVKEYVQKYPEIVKPIYQSENQYSKGIQITHEIQIPRAEGKYIAFCEGDDYWTDPEKLQIQYDFMEAHPEYSICCHAYRMVDKDKNLLEERFDLSEDGIVPMKKLIGNQLEVPHFATLFIRSNILKQMPCPFLNTRPNDMLTRLFCAANAPIYYLNRCMSDYRRFVDGSWTVRVGKNREKFLESQRKNIAFLTEYDRYTNEIYHADIQKEISKRNFEISMMEGNYRAAKKNEFFSCVSFKKKIGILIGCIFPKLICKLSRKRSKKS